MRGPVQGWKIPLNYAVSYLFKRSDDEIDAECEKAFRRGYVCGIQAMMSAIVDKLSKPERQDFETWFANELKPWSQRTGTSYPPEPPPWR